MLTFANVTGQARAATALFLGVSVWTLAWAAPAAAQEEKKDAAPAPAEGEAGEAALKFERELGETYDQAVQALESGSYGVARTLFEKMIKSISPDGMSEPEMPKAILFVRIFERDRRALRVVETAAGEVERVKAQLDLKKQLTPEEENLKKLCEDYPKFMQYYRDRRRQIALDAERIKRLVPLLGKGEGIALDAARQLEVSGAYAVPAMIDALGDIEDTALKMGIQRCILQNLQSKAVEGLLAAMKGHRKDTVKRFCAEVLGDLAYPNAIPALLELAGDKNPDISNPTREAAMSAFNKITHGGQKGKTVSQLYYELAEAFFKDKITPRPEAGSVADVWVWEAGRVVPKRVPYDAYVDALARRHAWNALRTAPENDYKDAWAMLLCAIHRFEAKMAAAGATEDPLKPVEKWVDSAFTTVSAGPDRIVAALMKGLDPSAQQTPAHTAMNTKLLQALSLTGGRDLLLKNRDALDVLANGLSHPNQVVRIETAINAVKMHPDTRGELWTRVVPTLAEAVVMSGKDSVLLVSGAPLADPLALAFQEAGFEVVRADSASAALNVAAKQAGFALAVVVGTPEDVQQLRTTPALKYVTIALLADKDKQPAFDSVMKAMGGYALEAPAAAADAAKATAEHVKANLKKTPLDPALSESYAVRALELIAKMADARDKIFDYLAAERSLAVALESDEREAVQKAAAKALGLFPTAAAQKALAAAAVKPGKEPVQLAALAGLAESGRKNGPLMNVKTDAKLIEALGTLSLEGGSQDLKTGASAALGALNLASGKVYELIIKAQPADGQ